MPVNPVVPDTAEVRVHFGLPGNEEMVNVFNVDVGATTLDATLATSLANTVEGCYQDHLLTTISDLVGIDRIVVTDLRVANGPQFTISGSFVGSNADSLLPTQTAAVVRWTTNTRGRSFRGRTFLGGFTEATSSGQSPAPAALTDFEAFAAAIIADLSALTHPLVIVSRYEPNPTPPPSSVPRAANIATEVTGSFVDRAWHTMRSRALKG